MARRQGAGRFWPAIVNLSLRRPLRERRSPATALLVVLAIPAFSMHTKLTGTSDLPRSLEVMRVYDRMQAAFPGGQIPAVVAVTAKDVRAPQVRAAIAALERARAGLGPLPRARRRDRVRRPARRVGVAADGRRRHERRRPTAALAQLRGTIVPQTVGPRPGAQAYVTGMTAGTKDFNDLMKARAPLVFAFVLTLAFLLLLVTFRSIVVPVKAIVLNLLSVGAAYGVLVRVFQDGHLRGPARLPQQRRDRQLAADVPVRDPVRPEHGLPRVHPQPGARGGRPRPAHRGRGPRGHPVDGRDGDERRVRDGRRVRDLRDAEPDRLQADGRRPGRRDPDRRDDRPRRAAAGRDEAARRAQLVPARAGSSGCRGSPGRAGRSAKRRGVRDRRPARRASAASDAGSRRRRRAERAPRAPRALSRRRRRAGCSRRAPSRVSRVSEMRSGGGLGESCTADGPHAGQRPSAGLSGNSDAVCPSSPMPEQHDVEHDVAELAARRRRRRPRAPSSPRIRWTVAPGASSVSRTSRALDSGSSGPTQRSSANQTCDAAPVLHERRRAARRRASACARRTARRGRRRAWRAPRRSPPASCSAARRAAASADRARASSVLDHGSCAGALGAGACARRRTPPRRRSASSPR